MFEKFKSPAGFVSFLAILLEIVGFIISISEIDDLDIASDQLRWHNVLAFFVAISLFFVFFFGLDSKYEHLVVMFAVVAAVALSVQAEGYDNNNDDTLFAGLVLQIIAQYTIISAPFILGDGVGA